MKLTKNEIGRNCYLIAPASLSPVSTTESREVEGHGEQYGTESVPINPRGYCT